jgi:hypothetical protein
VDKLASTILEVARTCTTPSVFGEARASSSAVGATAELRCHSKGLSSSGLRPGQSEENKPLLRCVGRDVLLISLDRARISISRDPRRTGRPGQRIYGLRSLDVRLEFGQGEIEVHRPCCVNNERDRVEHVCNAETRACGRDVLLISLDRARISISRDPRRTGRLGPNSVRGRLKFTGHAV